MNTTTQLSLFDLGWKPALQQQITFAELETGFVARVINIQRDQLTVISESGELSFGFHIFSNQDDPEYRATVGDWIWMGHNQNQGRVLERLNHLKRTAAGSNPKPQSIAANIDTIFLVSSCNNDFNIAKLERFLVLIRGANIPAVIVLTKSDLTDDVQFYIDAASTIHRDIPVISINALNTSDASNLDPWLGSGQSIAFIGSSGVGKSTLTNLLLNTNTQTTQKIREDDAKGRHTTTDRTMHLSHTGTWIIDTPGMRELKLPDISNGLTELFDDIQSLMQQCKFHNCRHESDAGCAIQAAISNGKLSLRRWNSFLKLQREAEFAASNKWQQREKNKAFGKKIKKHLKQRKADKY